MIRQPLSCLRQAGGAALGEEVSRYPGICRGHCAMRETTISRHPEPRLSFHLTRLHVREDARYVLVGSPMPSL